MRFQSSPLALALLLAAPATYGDTQNITENTLRLAEGEARPAAKIASVAWLAGSWRGSGLGGEVEEIWTAPSGGSMMGASNSSRAASPPSTS